jgi:hypothetical protein
MSKSLKDRFADTNHLLKRSKVSPPLKKGGGTLPSRLTSHLRSTNPWSRPSIGLPSRLTSGSLVGPAKSSRCCLSPYVRNEIRNVIRRETTRKSAYPNSFVGIRVLPANHFLPLRPAVLSSLASPKPFDGLGFGKARFPMSIPESHAGNTKHERQKA